MTGYAYTKAQISHRLKATMTSLKVENWVGRQRPKFVTASDVMERICTNPAFRQSMSNKDISMFMEALGFKKIHRKTGNGWKVIEMRPDEIENNQKMDGSEDIPPGDLPF